VMKRCCGLWPLPQLMLAWERTSLKFIVNMAITAPY
jgi:hypothetical protein